MHTNRRHISIITVIAIQLLSTNFLFATNYTVSDKVSLQTKMNSALPGDTVIVSNGTYNNWGTITITNTKANATSAWIVLKAQTFNGVVFTGTTNLLFSGKRILITGFKFSNGKASNTNDVIQFRTSSSVFASYCRLNNITIDNFNSDSSGSYLNNGSDIDNKWISIYGINNRVDHCTFINKFNAGATVVVWYDNNTYPQQSTSTYHKIDSNYFNGRGYLGANGGESIRVGVSTTSRTNGYNFIEYNLFENCAQVEPEIISNKSNFNTYRFNTFKNCNGGLTLRHGRYCSVYNNFFIVETASNTKGYGVRVIDKGHKIYNNYFEGLNGNKNSITSLRCPIILYNGLSSTNDTTDAAKASGYFPADSTMIAFNTVVNCSGGAGIVLGYTDGGANTFQPKGIQVSNNLIKMTTGQVAQIDASNTALTYTAEGNFYNAPSFGLSSSTGFTSKSLSFTSRTNGILMPPSLVQDAAMNTSNYTTLLNNIDALGKTRTAIFDVGCTELNGTGNIISTPLDSIVVGAGKPVISLSVYILSFTAKKNNQLIQLNWIVENEINFKQYEVEYSLNGIDFKKIETIKANNQTLYQYQFSNDAKCFVRLKLVDNNGSFIYTNILMVSANNSINIYPNPAKDYIHIQLKKYGTNVSLRLVDVTGKVVKKVENILTEININTNEFISGIYHIQIAENNQILHTYPIIISK